MPGAAQKERSEEEARIELWVRADIKTPSLYDIGYLNIDILHIIILSQLIQQNEHDEINALFIASEKENYLFPNRYKLERYFERFHDSLAIRHISLGSLELVIASIGAAGAIIIPFVFWYINRATQKVIFNYNSNDHNVRKMIEYLDGIDGLKFDDWFKLLAKRLSEEGYNIEANSDNIYTIFRATVERTARTMMTVIKVNKH